MSKQSANLKPITTDTVTACRCQIQWIDETGQSTPDQNPAIGRCRVVAHTAWIGARSFQMTDSPWFYICAAHAERLTDLAHWTFEPLEGGAL